MDVDNMSEADLMVNFKVILNENTQLKLVNGVIAEKLNELSSDVVKLTEKTENYMSRLSVIIY